MLNQILKFTVLTSIWLWLKPRWRALLAFVVSLVIINILHGEYVKYVEISGNQDFLVWSYILKWSAMLICILAYLLVSAWSISSKKPLPAKAANEPSRLAARVEGQDDGFDFIRRKKKLNSQTEKLLEASKARDGKNTR
jgi:hypothetical protein